MSNAFSSKQSVNMIDQVMNVDLENGDTRSVPVVVVDKPKHRIKLPPPAAPAVVDSDIKDMILKIPGFKIISSIKYVNTATQKEGMAIWVDPPSNVGVMERVWNFIRGYWKDNDNYQEIVYDKIDDMCSSNNTIVGCLKNIMNKMPPHLRTGEIFLNKDYKLYMRDYVNTHLPCKDIEGDITTFDMMRDKDLGIFDVVPGSDAGFPFAAHTKNPMEHPKSNDNLVFKRAMILAQKYATLLASDHAFDENRKDSFVDYMKRNPLEFTYLMKRKFERQQRDKFNEKVRSYYVCPLALKLLFKWVSFYMLKQSTNFTEDVNSSSAYKFSFAYGGADKLMKWARSKVAQAVKLNTIIFHALCFGDDNLWVFSLPDGRIVVYFPDFEAMDMRTPSVIGPAELFRHRSGIEKYGRKYSKQYENICKLLSVSAFDQNVLVHRAIRVHKTGGLISGIPATTLFSIHASVLSQYFVSDVVDQINNVRNRSAKKPAVDGGVVTKIVDTAVRMIKSVLGMTIKPATLTPQVIVDDITGFSKPFLGYIIEYSAHKKHFYPVPADLDKCWGSLALPSSPIGGDKQDGVLMARIYGLLLSGATFNDGFDGLARALYADVVKTGGVISRLEMDELVMDRSESTSFLIAHPTPPLRDWIEDFYMGIITRDEVLNSEATSVGSVEELDIVPNFLFDEFGTPKMPQDPPIPVSMVGKTIGAPLEVKIAKQDARIRARQSKVDNNQKVGGKKKKKGTNMLNKMSDDDDEQFFTPDEFEEDYKSARQKRREELEELSAEQEAHRELVKHREDIEYTSALDAALDDYHPFARD
jgi:hypothetical protein